MIYYNNIPLNTFTVESDGSPSARYAEKVLKKYLTALCGTLAEKSEKRFEFSIKDQDEDSFSLKGTENGISIFGGKRGVIYGTYEFLERFCGCRFFAPDCEYLPDEDKFIEKIDVFETSIIKYREVLGNSSGNEADSFLKFRFNSNFWDKILLEEHGGGYSMAGIPAHSLTGEYLLKPYVKSNPEYFSLVDGNRLVDGNGQICFSSEGALEAAKREVIKYAAANPQASFISVTPGDNGNFCQCSECRKKYETKSISELFLNCVNEIAKSVKAARVKTKIHTFAYGAINKPPENTVYEDNIVLQFCNGTCKNHNFTDEHCPINGKIRRDFENWSRAFSKILVWDYSNCFKYQMINLPELGKFRDRISYYASHHAFGLFFEYVHRKGDNACVFSELKTYVLSKLMWNPYMQESEYERHIREFMRAYYGAGYENLIEYIRLWENSVDSSLHFDYSLGNYQKCGEACLDLIAQEKAEDFFIRANKLWEAAEKAADGLFLQRIKKERLQFTYLEQLICFDKIMQTGTADEKEVCLEKNKKLIEDIVRYGIKITYWGQTLQMQQEEMPSFVAVSPRKWNYKW